jgi:hypothetical protein
MKQIHLIYRATILIVILTLTSGIVKAQTGPSDVTSAAPTSASSVNQLFCNGANAISITGPQDVNGVDYTVYHWYKVNGAGTQTLTSVTSKIYTETTTTTAGYYNYVLITESSTGCTSSASAEYKVYVLPALAPVITAASNSICSSTNGSSLLTATVTSTPGLSLTYQWTRNGVNIAGATSSTYNVTGETVAATVTFGVIVSYVINPTCTVTATKAISVIPMPGKPVITAS